MVDATRPKIIDASITETPDAKHLAMEELQAGLEAIRQSPKEEGVLHLIVRRPEFDRREILEEGQLDLLEGLVGDAWRSDANVKEDGSLDIEDQLTMMNTRVIGLISPDKERWALAGDQLYVELDLSAENMPPGTRLALGSTILEVTALEHRGCSKFMARYGQAALKFIEGRERRDLQMRGIYVKVIQPGTVRVGDVAKKL